MIAVALFTIAIIFFYSVSSSSDDERRVQNLQTEGSKLLSAVSGIRNETPAFVEGTKIRIDKLEQIADLSYSQLKDALGIQADFCIHFEDERGNVINISGNKTGLGSAYVVVGGAACG